jgi:hypothetical protein
MATLYVLAMGKRLEEFRPTRVPLSKWSADTPTLPPDVFAILESRASSFDVALSPDSADAAA